MFWWEKHVEYKFIKEADYDFAFPLSGQAEAALSDLIFGSRDKLVLIEFKRDRAALSSEAKKFTKSLDDVETALEDHPKCHYFVYAVVADNCFSLEGCGYFNREAISPRDILKRGVGLEEFKSYCESLMSYRAPDERCSSVFSFSGLEQVVGISPEGVKAVTFSEFLAKHHPGLSPAEGSAPKRLGPGG